MHPTIMFKKELVKLAGGYDDHKVCMGRLLNKSNISEIRLAKAYLNLGCFY